MQIKLQMKTLIQGTVHWAEYCHLWNRSACKNDVSIKIAPPPPYSEVITFFFGVFFVMDFCISLGRPKIEHRLLNWYKSLAVANFWYCFLASFVLVLLFSNKFWTFKEICRTDALWSGVVTRQKKVLTCIKSLRMTNWVNYGSVKWDWLAQMRMNLVRQV